MGARDEGTRPARTTASAGELPGFFDALARLSPEMFDAFRELCAVPWRSGVLRANEKELIYLSVDAWHSGGRVGAARPGPTASACPT